MPPLLKKFVTIAIATLFGVLVVSTVLYENKISTQNTSSVSDSKWRDSLVVIPSRTPSALLGAEYAQSGSTTTTDFVAQTFVENYARAQVAKGAVPLEDTDIQNLVQTLSEKTRAVDTVKQYTEQDIVVVPASTSTIETYKEKVTSALNEFAQTNKESELKIVAQALDDNDASKLAGLNEVITAYQTLVDALIKAPVPRTTLTFHLSLLQGYANMQAGIADMQEIIIDPVRGMRGIAKYNNGAGLVGSAVAMLHTKK